MIIGQHTRFLTDVSREIADRGLKITERLESGDSFDEILPEMYVLRNLIMEYEVFYFTGYELYDENIQVPFHDLNCISIPDKEYERVYREYCITEYAGDFYPVPPTPIFLECECGIPPGGNPGDYITINVNGNLVWQKIPQCVNIRQEFEVKSNQSEFSLPLNTKNVVFVYLNGVLLKTSSYTVDLDLRKLTISPPTKANLGDRLIVVTSNCSPRITEAGITVFNETIIYDDSVTIFLQQDPVEKHILFINGQFINSQDYSFNGKELILDPSLLMQNGDEIVIFYYIEKSVFFEEVTLLYEDIKQQVQSLNDYKVNDLGSITGAVTIDLEDGNLIKATLTGTVTLSFTNYPPSGFEKRFVLRFTNIETINYPSGTLFENSTAPVPSGSLYEIPCSIDNLGNLIVYNIKNNIG